MIHRTHRRRSLLNHRRSRHCGLNWGRTCCLLNHRRLLGLSLSLLLRRHRTGSGTVLSLPTLLCFHLKTTLLRRFPRLTLATLLKMLVNLRSLQPGPHLMLAGSLDRSIARALRRRLGDLGRV